MRVLALDTALSACSVCLFDAAADEIRAVQSLPMHRGHAEALIPLVERVMWVAGLGFDDIDRIVTTVGPGSFTGLRVGIAAARGFALALGRPAVGVTTLAALSAPVMAEDDRVPVVAAIDAKHGNVYMQIAGPGGRAMISPRVSSLRDAVRVAAIGKVRLVGSGAPLLAAAWPAVERPPLLVDPRGAPDIAWVARLGAATSPDALPRPVYLRPPDARPQDAARIARC
ncbi:tRNA (adenosine(37)-N6)-threonylcarbamoyltransferase complex dimerization subunit type 1 TsaB [Blastochloris sulfoviridis]|uniref:tRNA (Adenosine(37)-N6)-threonylcarbamoyltransferase complex dimerization subunit type 1 TsaB n=1 Tax=Blastochloris sulfoviridis TaxID=50712 RepID=A0A5M6I3Q4_9HYPH|nr:tRNA (adenosine(37)-N6)-threonylcarbamoyltransferase complex dimerization subunit type 1 TsaB [Blastochloris sulfoviridis]KAA5602479.1 tRNA (adenosine(37)-N6)-threonylcarbamoyltransferase complex dimerization subunit type 1 TsaB [Blastochloris sulfoviridis]